MAPPFDVANRLLKIELQLKAYQKLHEDELAQLWRVLNECKQSIAAFSDEEESGLIQVEMHTRRNEPAEQDE